MTPFSFIVVVLAVYRLTYLVVYEDAPFDLLMHFRAFVLRVFGEESWLWRGVNCPYCVSFWLSLLALILRQNLFIWLGVAGAVVILFKLLEKEA